MAQNCSFILAKLTVDKTSNTSYTVYTVKGDIIMKYGIPIYLILIILLLTLTGCATPPRWLAAMYDNADPCQTRFREEGYKRPSFCGKGKTPSKVIVYDYYSGRPVKY